jgi:hypothetical protein
MHPSGSPPRRTVPEVRRQHPERCDQNPSRFLLIHQPAAPALPDRPLATLRCSPTTCQTHEPAGLEMPPSAGMASRTRRRASSWRSLSSGSRPVPSTRRMGVARSGSSLAMNERCLEVLRRIARSILPSVSTVLWWSTIRPSANSPWLMAHITTRAGAERSKTAGRDRGLRLDRKVCPWGRGGPRTEGKRPEPFAISPARISPAGVVCSSTCNFTPAVFRAIIPVAGTEFTSARVHVGRHSI